MSGKSGGLAGQFRAEVRIIKRNRASIVFGGAAALAIAVAARLFAGSTVDVYHRFKIPEGYFSPFFLHIFLAVLIFAGGAVIGFLVKAKVCSASKERRSCILFCALMIVLLILWYYFLFARESVFFSFLMLAGCAAACFFALRAASRLFAWIFLTLTAQLCLIVYFVFTNIAFIFEN